MELLRARDEQGSDMSNDELAKSGRLRDKPASTAVLKEVVRDEQGRILQVLERAVEITEAGR